MIKFYDRKQDLENLETIEKQSEQTACFTVITGRRRIGKTALIKNFLDNKRGCYLFTSRSSEKVLCMQWQREIAINLGLHIYGQINSLAELFKELMLFSKQEHFTLVIDEFQDLQSINPSFFSEMQNIWDTYAGESKINLIVCGSVYSMMTKIFEDSKEPLFGRSNAKMNIKPFTPSVCKEILKDYNKDYSSEDLLCLYMLSGGVAKYISLLMESGSVTKEKMIDYVCNISSPFLVDGKDNLISEMGKDYGTYFSILSLISQGYTTQSEIDSVIQKNTGAYLANLKNVFNVVKVIRPLYAKENSRSARYEIEDCYLRFYFRFIYPNQSLIELGQYDMLKELILRDYKTFSGKTLELYFKNKILEEQQLTKIGGWWDKKSENEIDIIAINDLKKTCNIYEVKRKDKKIDLEVLAGKAEHFKENVAGYGIELKGLSMEDM